MLSNYQMTRLEEELKTNQLNGGKSTDRLNGGKKTDRLNGGKKTDHQNNGGYLSLDINVNKMLLILLTVHEVNHPSNKE